MRKARGIQIDSIPGFSRLMDFFSFCWKSLWCDITASYERVTVYNMKLKDLKNDNMFPIEKDKMLY